MRINSIKIEKLFEIFDYDISFKNDENVLIITGPNGFGKTMILNIIFSLFNRKFSFFQKLVFEKITLSLDGNISVTITKINKGRKKYVNFLFYKNDELLESFDFLNKIDKNAEEMLDMFLPFTRITSEKWRDYRTNRILTLDDVLDEYGDSLPDDIAKNIAKIKSKQVNDILNSIQVHLIKEQRLFQQAQNVGRDYGIEKEQTVMIETIQAYAEELQQSIRDFSQKSFIQTQELDSSYPNRLRSEKNILTEKEYEIRYNALKNKQKKLTEFGLYESKQEFLT